MSVRELDRIKKLIEDVKEERSVRIKGSCLRSIVNDYGSFYGYKQRINNKFITFLKEENANKRLLKWVKKFKFSTKYNKICVEFVKYSSDEWKVFSERLSLLDLYYSKYTLDVVKKELCHYTDCYKKMKSDNVCKRCKSVNVLEASYCNQCGHYIGETVKVEKRNDWYNKDVDSWSRDTI